MKKWGQLPAGSYQESSNGGKITVLQLKQPEQIDDYGYLMFETGLNNHREGV